MQSEHFLSDLKLKLLKKLFDKQLMNTENNSDFKLLRIFECFKENSENLTNTKT